MTMQMKSICLGMLLVVVVLAGTNANKQIPAISSGPPVNLRNASNTEVTLTCRVDILNDTVAWHYDGVEQFSCDFPYAAGTCTQAGNYSGYVKANKDVTTIRFRAMEDGIGGNWTCNIGGYNMSEPFAVDAGYSPGIDFSISPYNASGSGNVTLTCSAESEVGLDSLSIVQVTPVSDLFTQKNPTNITYGVTMSVPCTDNTFTCCVSNMYGYNCSSITINTSCKSEIKVNMTTFELEAKEGDESASFRLFFTGKPVPQYSWYREDESLIESLLTDYRTQQDTKETCNADNIPCMTLLILDPIMADTGNYIIRVNESTSGLYASYSFSLNVTNEFVEPTVVPQPPAVGCEVVPDLTFGQGIGAGIGIGICSIFFVAGAIYGFRKPEKTTAYNH